MIRNQKHAFEKIKTDVCRCRMPASLLSNIGNLGIRWTNYFGAATIFFAKSFVRIFRTRQLNSILQQICFIGAKTMTIIVLVALFTGMVMGLQLYYTLVKFGSVGVLGSAIGLSIIRELGPVLTAIMITGARRLGHDG